MNRIRTAYLTPESAMHDADETWPKEAQFYNPLAQRYVPLQIGAINPTSGAIKLLGPDVHNHSGQSLLGDEGTITWHVKVGERFEKGALLAEIKTLAGVHEIRAKAGGSISTILIQEGAVVDRSFVPLAELER
jgi:acetyl/propionyl-CoA carboxylase alpha subunit